MREYQRSFGKSYMIVSKEGWKENYQLRMAEQNDIYGLLPVKRVPHGISVQFWYDITGKNSIDMYMKNHKADARLLEKLINGLQKTCLSMQEYLLDEAGICLEPESIYISNADEQIYFCYQVYEQNNFELEFRNFMEFFLQKMEHMDQESVRICYGIYDCCAGGHFQLENIMGEFYQDHTISEEQEATVSKMPFKPQMPLKPQLPINRKTVHTGGADSAGNIEDVEKINRRRVNLNLSFLQNKTNNLSKAIIEIINAKKHRDDVVMFEPSEEEEIQISNPTIFLGSESKDILGQLKYEGTKTGTNFIIDKSPYVLGNKEYQVDGFLAAVTVSRIHAKITIDDQNNYCIEDMNSTNGTYVNGKILNYRETYILCKNDAIQFADIAYRFV